MTKMEGKLAIFVALMAVIVSQVRGFPGAKAAQSRKYCSWYDKDVPFDQKAMTALNQMHYLMRKSNSVPTGYEIPAPYNKVTEHLDGKLKYKEIQCEDAESDLNGLYKPVVNVGKCISTKQEWLNGNQCTAENMQYQKWDRRPKIKFFENWITTTIRQKKDNGFDCVSVNHNRNQEKKTEILASNSKPDAEGNCQVAFKRGWIHHRNKNFTAKQFLRFRFHHIKDELPPHCTAKPINRLFALPRLANKDNDRYLNYKGHEAQKCKVSYPKFPNPKKHENPIEKANTAGCLRGVLRRARVFQDDEMPPINGGAIKKRCTNWDGLNADCSQECENRARLDRVGQQKVLHQIGASTYVRLDWNTEMINDKKYTGAFTAESLFGLMRMSTGARVEGKTKLSPSLAFKFWRDKTFACEILGMNGFSGVDGDNFWKYPQSTTVSSPKVEGNDATTNDFSKKLVDSVQTKKLKAAKRHQPAGHTSLFECALRKLDGTHKDAPKYPFKIDFRTNPIYIVYGEWILNGENITDALDKFKANTDTVTAKNPFEVFDMDTEVVHEGVKYTKFNWFLSQLEKATRESNSHMRLVSSENNASADIEAYKNTFYKVIGHDTAKRAKDETTCDCLGYVNRAFTGHNLTSNKFLDLNVRFGHYMSTQLANGSSYKDANGVRHKYFHRCKWNRKVKKFMSTDGSDCKKGEKTVSQTRWESNKKDMENEDLMNKQDPLNWAPACEINKPDEDKPSVQVFLTRLKAFGRCSSESLHTISLKHHQLL